MSRGRQMEWCAGLLVAALCCVFVFYQSFLVFVEYDDEGHMLLKARHFLEGRAIYDSILDIYGPFYYLASWFTYSALRVPFTTDMARLVNMVYWLTTAGLCAASVWRVTGRFSLTILTLVAVVLELQSFREGVSHPQALSACLLGLFVLAATWLDGKRLTGPLAVCATVAGALLFTKINLGIFASLALVYSLTVGTERNGLWRVARWLTLLSAAALPWVLMRAHLFDRSTLIYAIIMSTSPIFLYWAARSQQWDARLPRIPVLVIVYMLPGLVSCVFMFTHGTTPVGLFGGIIVNASKLGGAFFVGLQTGWKEIDLVSTATVLMYLLTRQGSQANIWQRVLRFLTVFFKLALGCHCFLRVLLPLAPGLHGSYGSVLGSVCAPFLGLTLLDPLCVGSNRRTRLVVCSLALFEFLMAYPVAGAQKYIGSFLFIPIAAFWVADSLEWLESIDPWAHYSCLIRRLECSIAILLSLSLLILQCGQMRKQYQDHVPLELAGAHWLRLEESQVVKYRWLAANIDEHADTFLVNIGLNSEYLWTKKQPPSTFVLGHALSFFSDDEQRELFSALRNHRRNLFIYHAPVLPLSLPTERDLRPLLLQEVQAAYQDRGAAGGYHLFTPKNDPAPVLVECGQWTGPDTFQVVTSSRPGVGQLARLVVYDVDSRREVASTSADLSEGMASLTLDPVALDLSGGGIVNVKVQENGTQLLREHSLIIRLYDEHGQCIGRLPFLEELDPSHDPMKLAPASAT